jgi:uncharacterized protein YbjT (DUF2867 family)
MNVLVTGASGFVGQRLVPALLAADHDVSVLVRDQSGYDAPEGVTVFEGDVLAPDGLAATMEDIDAVYYLVHAMGAGGGFEERDRRGARNFMRAADQAGVDRVVYLSGLGVDADDLSPHLRSRREVERVLAEGAYELTVLRAAIIIGDGSASFSIVHQLSSRLPVMITPRWVSTLVQPIAISDVIAYLAGVLDAPDTAGETYEIGGPEVVTLAEVAKLAYRARGKSLTILPVPMVLAGLGLSVAGAIPGFPMGADQYRSLQFDNSVADNDVDAFGVDVADLTTLATYLGVSE